jgi:hypothetical protein
MPAPRICGTAVKCDSGCPFGTDPLISRHRGRAGTETIAVRPPQQPAPAPSPVMLSDLDAEALSPAATGTAVTAGFWRTDGSGSARGADWLLLLTCSSAGESGGFRSKGRPVGSSSWVSGALDAGGDPTRLTLVRRRERISTGDRKEEPL